MPTAAFSPSAYGLASLMLSAQTLEALKVKGVMSQEEVVAILNKCLSEFRATNTPEAIEAGGLLLQFYNAVPDVSLLTPKADEATQ